MEFYNSAILHDELLLNIILVLERGQTPGPAFLHSLGSLIEAVTIHDRVYYDPLHRSLDESDDGEKTDDGESVDAIIRESAFVRELVACDALSHFYDTEDVNKYLEQKGSEYRTTDFLIDSTYMGHSFCSKTVTAERNNCRLLVELISAVPDVFEVDELLSPTSNDIAMEIRSPIVPKLAAMKFSASDMHAISGLNHRAKAYNDISSSLGCHLYPVLAAMPHQIGATNVRNMQARQIYEKIKNHVTRGDIEAPGSTALHRVSIPPLCQIVLDRCMDSAKALGSEICRIRNEHIKFRTFLTEYERRWVSAKSREERNVLTQEFDNAWKTFVERESRPTTRIVYMLWNVLKKLNPLEGIGDILSKFGHEESIIGKVSGLHDFTKSLNKAPVREKNHELLRRVFKNLAQDDVWQAASELADSSNGLLLSQQSVK